MTAVVGVPILLAIILFGPSWAWSLVVLLAIALGLVEFYSMTLNPEEIVVKAMGIAMGVGLGALMSFSSHPVVALAGCVTAVMVMFLTALFAYDSIERAAHLALAGVTGVLYVGLLVSFLALVRRDPGDMGRYWLLLLLAITWLGDTGAYFTGRSLGRHKLSPTVSPKKTWEGAVGGLLASVAGGFAVLALTPLALHPLVLLAAVIPAAVLGQLGDLCESLLKRSWGVKDSGRIIPGHGGILDRIDALMFAAPYLYFFFIFGGAGIG
ncbi:MAG: phosphatidate cytidylyltransferase [Bradymonadales bacterium]|nr:phosphatidate cytidylyltransferase [Bradymonadales bacterium]